MSLKDKKLDWNLRRVDVTAIGILDSDYLNMSKATFTEIMFRHSLIFFIFLEAVATTFQRPRNLNDEWKPCAIFSLFIYLSINQFVCYKYPTVHIPIRNSSWFVKLSWPSQQITH